MRPTSNNVLMTGSSGSGKSYFITDCIVRDWLPYSPATIITNLPVGLVPEDHFCPPKYEGETFIERISEYSGIDASNRLKLIDADMLRKWELGRGGPWDLEIGTSTYLIVDELALYCHMNLDPEVLQKWIDWLGHARHANVRNLFITQTLQKVPRPIHYEFGERWQFMDTANEPGMYGVAEGDWNQLLSKWKKFEVGSTQCIVRNNEGGTYTQRKGVEPFRVRRIREVFELYDSFNAPTDDADGVPRTFLFEILTWRQLLGWFMGRNRWFCFKVMMFFMFVFGFGFYRFGDQIFERGKDVQQVEAIKEGEVVAAIPQVKRRERKSDDVRVIGHVGRLGFAVRGNARMLVLSPKGEGERVGADVSSAGSSSRNEDRIGSGRSD